MLVYLYILLVDYISNDSRRKISNPRWRRSISSLTELCATTNYWYWISVFISGSSAQNYQWKPVHWIQSSGPCHDEQGGDSDLYRTNLRLCFWRYLNQWITWKYLDNCVECTHSREFCPFCAALFASLKSSYRKCFYMIWT